MTAKTWIIGGLMFLGLLPVWAQNFFDASARVERVADGFGFTEGAVADEQGNLYFTDIPNGVIGTADGKWLYVSDTVEKKVRRFAIREDGSLAEETVFVASYSDGMTLDEAGNLYLTNGGVDIYASEGRLITTIPVPEKAANVGFGGVDHRTLFITARHGVYAILGGR